MPITKSEIRFEAESHTYWLGKKRLPSVSEILKTLGLSKDFTSADTFYRDRGKAGHKCIELYLKGDLDESSIDPILVPFFDGFRRYWDEHKEEIEAIETVRYNDDWAGTIDLLTAKRVIDWKFSKSHDKVAELQGEGYKQLTDDHGVNWREFRVVVFPGDGTFEIFDYGTEVENWNAVMRIYRWKKGLPNENGTRDHHSISYRLPRP